MEEDFKLFAEVPIESKLSSVPDQDKASIYAGCLHTLRTVLSDILIRSFSNKRSSRHCKNVLKWPADPTDFASNLLLCRIDKRNQATCKLTGRGTWAVRPPRPILPTRLKRSRSKENGPFGRTEDLERDVDEELFLSGEDEERSIEASFIDDGEWDDELNASIGRKPSPLVPMEHSTDLNDCLIDFVRSQETGKELSDIHCKSLAQSTASRLGNLLTRSLSAWSALGGLDGRLLAADADFIFAQARRLPYQFPPEVVDRAEKAYNEMMKSIKSQSWA